MSDSEEDFASADEGEESAAAGSTVDPQRSEKEDKNQQKETKAVEKTQTGKTAAKSDSVTEENKEKQNKEKATGKNLDKSVPKQDKGKSARPVKVGAGSSGKESGKKTALDSEKQDKDVHEKGKQKQQAGKGKKGKQKQGKGLKTGLSEKGTSESSKDVDENTDVQKDTATTKKENTDKELENESNENVDNKTSAKEGAKTTESQGLISDEKSAKDSVMQPERTPDLKSSPEKSKDIVSADSQENLTLEQKVNMIKSPSSQSITRPEPDHTDKQEAVLEKLAGAAKEKKGGWGWGWGSSLLEVASSSVTTFTSQVGEGLHTMMETVESTLNVPDPEELAQKVAKQTDTSQEKESENKDGEPAETAGSDSKRSADTVSQSMSEDSLKNAEAESEKKPDNQSKSENIEKQPGNAEKESDTDGKKADNQSGDGWFSAWGVSNITKIVENTGKNLVTGGLDVLETLGKKTFDVINEHDPGLKKARAFLHDRGDKPNLSATLRDAKEQYETQLEQEKESEEARKAHFGSLFDDFQGLAHLEALEMLSNQSEKRVNVLLNALPPEAIAKLKPQLLKIKQNFEIGEEEEDVTEQDFTLLVTDLMKELNVGTTADKITKTRKTIEEQLTKCCETESQPDVKEVHRVAISSLAELTSKCIEQFHKAGELILIQKSTVSDFSSCSNTLLRLTKVLTAEVGILSTKFSDCLNKHEGEEIKVSHLVTNIYLEASNSSSYIQDGFQLLLPVLQQAAIERSQEPAD